MAYQRTVYRFRNAVEIEDHHSARYGAPGESRKKKAKPTPDQIEKQNQYQREKKCRHKLRAHFDTYDYFATLTYAKENRPSNMDQAKADFKAFLQRVRREYKKQGCVLKWIRNIEVGTRGAWHIHLVINRIRDLDRILMDAWPHGIVDFKLLYQKGEFAELAKYMTKTPKTDPRLREADYSTARNLPGPKPEKQVHYHWKITDRIRVPKGWYLDKESLHEGINPVTGYPYRTYTLLRLQRKGPPGKEKKDGKSKKRIRAA